MTVTQTTLDTLPNIETPAICQIFDAIAQQPCRALADFLVRMHCGACGAKYREFICAGCLDGTCDLFCDRCDYVLTILDAQPIGRAS